MHGRKSRCGAPFQSTFAPDNGNNSNIYIIIINERIMSIKIKVNGAAVIARIAWRKDWPN